jgi:PTS system nitrogen regulatory IIA component
VRNSAVRYRGRCRNSSWKNEKNLVLYGGVAGLSREGVNFDAVDRQPVHIFFLVLAPEDSASLHLKVLSRIIKSTPRPVVQEEILKLNNAHDIYTNIN